MYTLLIADDEIRDLQFLQNHFLKHYKNKISVVGMCSNGRDAYKKYVHYFPDIVFLDVVMPIMDGLETAAKIKEKGKETEIVIISAHSIFDYAKKAINIGVTDYLLKPYLEDELDEIMQRILQRLDAKKSNKQSDIENLFCAENSPYVRLAIKYIVKNFAANLSLQSVAAYVGVSSGYLGKSFKKETGLHFNDVVTKIRIEKAKKMLLNTVAIYSVAESCGFYDANYFSKCFKKETGQTPKDFQKLHSEK